MIDDNPILVFIDTSTFENQNFAFGGMLLKSIKESCNEASMELLMVDVTAEEIRRRIRKNAKAAEKEVKRVKKEIRFLGHDRDIWPKLRDSKYYGSLAERVISEFDQFLTSANVTTLNADDVTPSKVFERYFAVVPPFSIGKKEKEFADAFAFEAVLGHSVSTGRTVYVVSSDDDFVSACDGHDNLSPVANLESAIELSLRTPDDVIDACHEWLHENISEVFKQADARLKQVRYSLNAPGGLVNSMECLDSELLDEAVVELGGSHAVLVGAVLSQVRFNVEYQAEGESYYDTNDRLVIPYDDIQRDLTVYLSFPFRLTMDISMRAVSSTREITFDIDDEVEILPKDDWQFEIHTV